MLYARLITLTLVCSVLLAGCIDRTKLKPSPENARRALILRGIEYSEAEFLQYAGVGDLWAVNTFLAAGINPNARNEREETALIVAAARGDLPVVRATLSGRRGRQRARQGQPHGVDARHPRGARSRSAPPA